MVKFNSETENYLSYCECELVMKKWSKCYTMHLRPILKDQSTTARFNPAANANGC